jgi:hypothetical protein
LDGWGKHRYLVVVCMGFEIATGVYDPNRAPASPDQRRRDETNEVAGRCRELTAAISAATAQYNQFKTTYNVSPDLDKKILKIFMAPEFFFRGPYGAYRDVGFCSQILSMMRTETGKPEYANWLFVHGTALFSTEKMEKGVKKGLLLENYALVQKGGPKTREHYELVVAKEFPSHVDFEHPGVDNFGWYNYDGQTGKHKPGTSKANIAGVSDRHFAPEGGRRDYPFAQSLQQAGTKQVSELVGGSIFTMDGVTFGLEVCRDHLLGRLAHSKESGKVLIQLIPSCGASITHSSIACTQNGVIFNVDGGQPPSVDLKVNNNSPDPGEESDAPCGAGRVVLYEAQRIPWPGLVKTSIADYLNMNRSVISGTAPIPPPRVPPRPRA